MLASAAVLPLALVALAVLSPVRFPSSGSPAAQPAFLRGVTALHNFQYEDAVEAFREAQAIDRDFAMAYWGEAMAYNQPLWYNENLDKARAALNRLAPAREARAARAPTDREREFLEAVERLYGDGDKPTRDRAYLARMAGLTRQFPDDDEAAAFYALALLASIPQSQRNPAISLQAGAIATRILQRNPQHPGAAHYALHAYDDGEHAAMGLQAARVYATIAPASSHARHMPSHIFVPLGMWDEAARSDESAFSASVDRAKRKGLSAAEWDFHSLSWLQYESLQLGQFAKAKELVSVASGFSRTGEGPPEGGHHIEAGHVESEIGRGFGPLSLKSELASMRARLIVESGDWDAMRGQSSFDNIDELFALGLSSVKLGDLARADAAVDHLANAARVVPDPDAREIAAIMAAELEGVLRVARGDRAAGLAALARAAALEAKRPKPIARPYPIKPAAELYGETLAAAGDPSGAIQQFRSALARTPNRAPSLIGLAQAAGAAGAADDARRAAKMFLTIWRGADAGRREILLAKALATPTGK
jgi:tetratricopeptide (TPR) repeat protein